MTSSAPVKSTAPYVDVNLAYGELCKRNFKIFVKEFWDVVVPDALIWNWHLDVLCELVEETDRRVFANLPAENDVIINVPPGTSKTMVLCVMATAWDFACKSDIRVFVGSYSDDAVKEMADKIRLIMQSEKYMLYFPNVKIRRDKNSIHQFKTVDNGEFYAFTVGGTLMSKHANILRVDDPINPKSATSKAEIVNVNKKFFDKTIPSRKTNKLTTVMYLIMQRLAVNDPTAHLLEKAKLKKRGIRHICLPAVVSDEVKPIQLKDRYINGLLDPVRLSQEIIDDLTIDMSTMEASAQLGQKPVPSGGTTIKRKWFPIVEASDLPREVLEARTDLYVDTALTSNTANDPSGVLAGAYHDNLLYLFFYWWGHKSLNDLVHKIREIGKLYTDERSSIVVELKANGHDVINELNRIFVNEFNVIPLTPTGEKGTRLKTYQAAIESGRVVIVRGIWNSHFLDEVCGFGVMPHDESVDCLTMACKRTITDGSDDKEEEQRTWETI